MYIYAFLAMHLIFALKYILSILIKDEPEWVAEDKDAVKNRILQT